VESPKKIFQEIHCAEHRAPVSNGLKKRSANMSSLVTPTMTIMNEYQRRKELGDFGEIVVCEQLSENGYQSCTRIGGNNECYDVEAYKGGQKNLFSIKTRNHTTHTGALKEDPYNLFHNGKKGCDLYAKVQTALKSAHSQNAIPMWATVRVDAERQEYTIYYGRVADLKDKRYVPMSQNDRLWHHKLAENVFDPRINPEWSNVKKKILPTPSPSSRLQKPIQQPPLR
jgi:hypothetical protein